MSDDDDKIKIELTDMRPVTISKRNWPKIASTKDWDNQYEFQANRTWFLAVRQSEKDSRCIVYGWFTSQFQSEGDIYGGTIVDSIDEVIPAIHSVCEDLFPDKPSMARDCINNLPSVEI